jgi:hypothetical protein
MTVREMRAMGNDEYTRWVVYYAREGQRAQLQAEG